jgi:hypothetical protein
MKSKNEEGTSTMMAPIAAGKARVKWMVASYRPGPNVESWRIVMDFDEEGDLTSYWESAFDEDGNELHGGGIGRADTPAMGGAISFQGGTIACKGFRLSPLQLKALLAGVDLKLDRSALGWLCDLNGPNEPAVLFRTVTIKSLHKQGLLDANFTDLRVHGGETKGVQNLDGAVHEHSLESPKTPKFEVWTSDLGKEVLRQIGLLPDDTQLLH